MMTDLRKQGGAATLLVSMILLIATTLLVLYTSGTAVTEQRISANELRAKQAMAAAQAGIDLSLQAVNDADDDDGDGNSKSDFSYQATTSDTNWSGANSEFRGAFCDASIAVGALPTCANIPATPACAPPDADDRSTWLVSCGWSDDNTARKRIITFAAIPPAAGANITNPLTAGGTVSMSGNPTVINYKNNLTVWSGGAVDNTGNNGKTVIRRPGVTDAASQCGTAGACTTDQVTTQVGNGNQVCNINQAPDLLCTTSSTVIGPDVNSGDPTLKNLSADPTKFFQNFMGLTPDQYKSLNVDATYDASQVNSDINLITGGDSRYWVDGNVTLSGNTTLGAAGEGNGVVLIVNGDLTITGSPTLYGLLYVTGDLMQSGGGLVRGAVVVQGTVSGNGSLNIIYDPDALGGNGPGGSYASYPGTWRDY